ncbi:MAG TPA: hypothetical protein VFK57_12955 [Vicinamibacterales bacterium]|nr:hypothetical protein [Vicinamibacterales bacterium]
MTRHTSVAFAMTVAVLLGPSIAGREPEVVARFGLHSPADGPFPSDRFTVADQAQNTGRRVSLPPPDDCADSISECEDLDVINQLDGFNLQPRLSIPFSGPIDPNTVNSETMFLLSLGSTLPDAEGSAWGTRVGINQVVWDELTETLHVESDELLDQHTRYGLVVTKGVRAPDGRTIKAAREFLTFVDDEITASTGDPDLDAYRALLRSVLTGLDTRRIVPKGQVVAASVFTTRSATAVLEKIRDQIRSSTPNPADFLLGPNGERSVFSASGIASVTWNRQMRTTGPLSPLPIDLSPIKTGAVGTIAFGKYLSPDYRVPDEYYIPPVATRDGEPLVRATNEVYFNLFLPSGAMPTDGWPVAIVGHGIRGSKNLLAPNAPWSMALLSALAAQGIASVTTNAVGAGFGSQGTLRVITTAGASVTFNAGGRGVDQSGDGIIAVNEGAVPGRPRSIVLYSDAFRQTAVDLMQLVRVIETGLDVDGDGHPELNPSRIYYDGGSWSGGYGTVFLGIEPNIRAAVLKSPADPVWFPQRGSQRAAAGAILEARLPSLVNSPGVTSIDGVAVQPPFFHENFPLRNQIEMSVELDEAMPAVRVVQSPVRNSVTGAMAIQESLERYEWVSQAGSPVAYAPHLRKAPLGDAAAKNVLYIIFKGDQTAPNPTTTAIVRAADLAERTMYYRHDLARLGDASVPPDPHGFNIASIAPQYLLVDATFFATDGAVVIRPAPAPYFEFPIAGPLPEGLNFIR